MAIGMEQIEKLKELAQKADRGRWKKRGSSVIAVFEDEIPEGAPDKASDEEPVARTFFEDDAEYIAAADPCLILRLISELEWRKREAEWLAGRLAAESYLCPATYDLPPASAGFDACALHCRSAKWREAARRDTEDLEELRTL